MSKRYPTVLILDATGSTHNERALELSNALSSVGCRLVHVSTVQMIDHPYGRPRVCDTLARKYWDITPNKYEIAISLFSANKSTTVDSLVKMAVDLFEKHELYVEHDCWMISNLLQLDARDKRAREKAIRETPNPNLPIHIRKPTTSTSYCGAWNGAGFSELNEGGTCRRCLDLSRAPIKATVRHPMARKRK